MHPASKIPYDAVRGDEMFGWSDSNAGFLKDLAADPLRDGFSDPKGSSRNAPHPSHWLAPSSDKQGLITMKDNPCDTDDWPLRVLAAASSVQCENIHLSGLPNSSAKTV